MAIVSFSNEHDARREGARFGFVAATGIWVWLAVVDAVAGHPFHTFTLLGGIGPFTVVHYLLNLVYGVALVSAIHASLREPGLINVVVFGFVIVEIWFAFATVLLSNLGLGELAWVRIFGGSLIGAVITIVMLSRNHPLLAAVRQAEQDNA